MKCQSLFSGKNKKNIINILSAEFAQRVVIVNMFSSICFETFGSSTAAITRDLLWENQHYNETLYHIVYSDNYRIYPKHSDF